MKLRIGKKSLRLRVLRSEVDALCAGQSLSETLRFSEAAMLTYVLCEDVEAQRTEVRFDGREISVRIPAARMQEWATTEQVGIYDSVDAGAGHTLELLLEKDFACLDRSDAENEGTYTNPNAGTAC